MSKKKPLPQIINFQPSPLMRSALTSFRALYKATFDQEISEGEAVKRAAIILLSGLRLDTFIPISRWARAERMERGEGFEQIAANVVLYLQECANSGQRQGYPELIQWINYQAEQAEAKAKAKEQSGLKPLAIELIEA